MAEDGKRQGCCPTLKYKKTEDGKRERRLIFKPFNNFRCLRKQIVDHIQPVEFRLSTALLDHIQSFVNLSFDVTIF